MSYRQETERELMNMIVRTTPQALWIALRSRAAWVYEESFDANANDPRMLGSQSGFKTTHDRHWFMERALHDAGSEYGFAAAPQMVKANRWVYTLMHFGVFSATQKYVRAPRDMASPSQFRKILAASGGISRQSSLFSKRPVEIDFAAPKNGIIIHGPSSRKPLSDGFRQVGFIRLAFPFDDYKDWASNFSLDEIIAEYENKADGSGGYNPLGNGGPSPIWKPEPKENE